MPRRASALERLERILAMVPWLLERPGVGVRETAERFGVSRAELVRDLDVLGYCGLPGYGGGDLIEASVVGDRVSVRMADYFRRPLRLSVREAVTLLLAARALASLPGAGGSPALGSAAAKLEAALGAEPALAIDLASPGDEHLPALRGAVADRRAVELTYRSESKAETTTRVVEPWAVVGAGGAWYLQGFCRLAQAPREFRLDRIRDLRVLDERLTAPAGERTLRPPGYQPGPDDHEVVLELDPEAWWIEEQIVFHEVGPGPDRRRIRFQAAELEWVARLLLRLGGSARVVAPRELAELVRARAEQTLRRYTSPR